MKIKVDLKRCPCCKGKADISLRDMREHSKVFVCTAFCRDCGLKIQRQYTVPFGVKHPEQAAADFISKFWNRRDS